MSAHTPGPWARTGVHFVDDANGLAIATLTGPRSERQEADARLIAAAPELLEACKAALQEQYERKTPCVDTVSALEKAIAKAEGREP